VLNIPGKHDLRARPRKRYRYRVPDTPPGAGDEGRFTGKIDIHRIPSDAGSLPPSVPLRMQG